MDAREFLPDLTREVLDEHRSWLEPAALEQATGKLIFCFQSYLVRTPHHLVLIDSCVGNDQNSTDPTELAYEDRPDLHVGPGVGRHYGRGYRLCDAYPSAPRPCRLEHAAREWTLGANIPERPLCILRSRARLLDATKRAKSDRLHRRQRSADRRGRSGRVGPQRSCPQRSCPIAANADHFAVLLGKSGAGAVVSGDLIHSPLQARYPELSCKPDYDRQKAARTRRAFLERFCDSGTLCCAGPLSITVGGSYRPVGRRISLRDRRGHRAISARGLP